MYPSFHVFWGLKKNASILSVFASEIKEVKQTACEKFRLFLIALITNDNWVTAHRFGRLIRELRALPMATTPGGENNLLSAIFFRILYVPHSKMLNFQTCNFL